VPGLYPSARLIWQWLRDSWRKAGVRGSCHRPSRPRSIPHFLLSVSRRSVLI